jgi:hypothetical protein
MGMTVVAAESAGVSKSGQRQLQGVNHLPRQSGEDRRPAVFT